MKFIAIGELMLRLSPPNYEKLVTTHDFRVNYGGAEAKMGEAFAADPSILKEIELVSKESQLLIILSLMMCIPSTL